MALIEIIGFGFLAFMVAITLSTTAFAFWMTFNIIREDLKNIEKN